MPTTEEEILEELKMLNANIQKLNVTLGKPRPTRAEFAAQREADEASQFLAEAWREEYARRKREGELS